MPPKVTVLLPAYNGGELLRAAIDSVLAQTYEDFELLVVDDCSSDGSDRLVAGYRDPRVRLLRNEENLGQIATLNRGLEHARGEYVARLDQDDACMPERLERQVAVLDAEPMIGVVGSFMDVHDDDGHVVWRARRRVDDAADFAFLALANLLPVAHPTVLFRRAVALELGGYDGSIRFAEDQDLWRRFALAGYRVQVVPEALVRYRVHAGQQSQRHWEEQQRQNRAALERFLATLVPDADARMLRLLLAWDDEFWASCRTPSEAKRAAADLERLVREAPARLAFDGAQAAKLERLLRARVVTAARRSWRSGVNAHWRAAPPLLRFGLRDAGLGARAAAALVYVIAPALPPIRAVEQGVAALWSRPALAPVKRRLKRRASARALYRFLARSRSSH